jgi:hypothetical protein
MRLTEFDRGFLNQDQPSAWVASYDGAERSREGPIDQGRRHRFGFRHEQLNASQKKDPMTDPSLAVSGATGT